MELPVKATRSNKLLGFDTNGDATVSTSTMTEIDSTVGAALGSGVLASAYQFTGDGTTVAFTLAGSISNIPNSQSVIVDIDGITQHTDTYTTATNVVTFSVAPPTNADIQVRFNAYLGDAVVLDFTDTITTLKALSPSVNSSVHVLGHYTVGDGGGGMFYWDATSTDTDNESTIIQASSVTTGRWKKVNADVTIPKGFYTDDNNPEDLTVLIAEGSDYQSFPHVVRNKKGVILTTWHHQQQHVGGGNSDLVCKISKDGGATWTSNKIIYGNLNGGDSLEPFWSAVGIDNADRFVIVFGITSGGANRPYIVRSFDGINWSDKEALTFTGESGSASDSITPFGEIKLLPSGKLGMVFYKADDNYVGIMDESVSTTTFALQTVVTSSTPAYSEAIFLPLSENVWFYFLREDAVAETVPYYVTDDGGATWTSKGDTGDGTDSEWVNGGGWLPQSAKFISYDDGLYIIMGVSARETVSAPITGAPNVTFFIAKQTDVFAGNAPWILLHDMSMPAGADGFTRDAYVNFIVDDVSRECLVVTNEETATDESRILIGKFNAANPFPTETPKQYTVAVALEGTGGTANTYGSPGPSLNYVRVGDLVTFYGTVVCTAINTTGPLKLTGLPFTLSTNQQVLSVSAYNDGTLTDVMMRSINGTGDFQLIERGGSSNVDSSEVDNNFNLRFSGTVFVD
jgi:hypothetical protein